MEVTAPPLRRILQVLHQALSASTVVAAGTTTPGAAVCLSGATTRRASPAASSACALSSQFNLKKEKKKKKPFCPPKKPAKQRAGKKGGQRCKEKAMQIKIFSIPVFGSNGLEDELNKFLRSHRILQVERHFCADNGGYWAIFVEYADYAPDSAPANRKERADVVKSLTDEEKERFEALRLRRRDIAKSNNIPAYMVFTDAELAQLAKLERIDTDSVRSLKEKEIAPSRLKTYIKFFYCNNEEGGQLDGEDSFDG